MPNSDYFPAFSSHESQNDFLFWEHIKLFQTLRPLPIPVHLPSRQPVPPALPMPSICLAASRFLPPEMHSSVKLSAATSLGSQSSSCTLTLTPAD